MIVVHGVAVATTIPAGLVDSQDNIRQLGLACFLVFTFVLHVVRPGPLLAQTFSCL